MPSGIVDNSSELPIKAGFIAEAKGRPKMNAFHDFMPVPKADGAVTIPLGVIPIQPRWMPCKFGIIPINQLIL